MCQAKTSTSGEASSDAAHPLQADVGADAATKDDWLSKLEKDIPAGDERHELIASLRQTEADWDAMHRMMHELGWVGFVRCCWQYARQHNLIPTQPAIEKARRAADEAQLGKSQPDKNKIQGADNV